MARSEYVVAVNVDNAEKLGRMRGHTGVTVFVDNDVIWLKGGTSHEDIDSALKSLPGRHFQLRDASDLIPAGNRLVSQRLSNPHWVPLSDWLKVEVPATAWPSTIAGRIPLRLVASDAVVESSAVLTSIDEVARFVDSASELRLQPLRFAMNPAGHIFVVGLPLPSVSGQRFWVRNNIAVPAGRHWLPAVDSATVRRVFEKSPSGDFCSGGDQLPANDVNAGGADSADTLLWLDSGHWEMIPSDAFTAMTRAAVRASRAAAGQRQIDEGSSA